MKTFKEMQNAFYKKVRQELLEGLARCTDAQCLLFKKMYAGGDLELPLHKVVSSIPRSKLDWAMQQVQRTLDKCGKEPDALLALQ